MDDVKRAIFGALMTVEADVVIDKKGICMWLNVSSSKK